MKHFAGAITFVFFVAGCANPINQRTAEKYYDAGLRAELAQNTALAEQNYYRALVNARLARSSDAEISAAMYSLGRMKAYLCKFDEGEKLLLEALLLEKKASGPESSITTKRLFELARFYSDRGLYAQSLPYFARGIPAVKKMGVETSDPIALADALEEYATALDSIGDKAQATAAKNEAELLWRRSPGKRAVFTPIRYKRSCGF